MASPDTQPGDLLAEGSPEAAAFSCQDCGACCSYSASWPRFSTESEDEIELIPPALVAADGSGMRCEGDRCAALKGEVGKAVACGIYGLRPDVCRVCLPGDPECLMARKAWGLDG